VKIAILGCGPTGLLAAHAASMARVPYDIFSRKEKSVQGGAQFLHEHIPDLTHVEADGFLRVRKWGGPEGYAEKVYGDRSHPTSFREFETGLMPAWSLRQAYDELWLRYSDDVVTREITAPFVALMVSKYDLVISTIPLPALCYRRDEHRFNYQAIKITDDIEIETKENNIMCYSGDKRDAWYRTSRIFGVAQTEWPYHRVTRGREGHKPIGNTCDCHAKVMRAGRFGKWQKGILTHHAFGEVVNALQQL
jgi:hypothetical protein